MKLRASTIAAIFALLPASLHANEYSDALSELARSQLSEWTVNSDLVAAIRAQNAAHANLSEDEIIALDNQWRSEVGQNSTPLITEILGRGVSDYLRAQKDSSQGLVTEVFVMDNRGLNVAQSDVTSDYWQGDEAKWSSSFGAGSGAIHIGDVELDESTQTYQSQVSLAVTDPDTGAAIGAITFGIDLEYLN